MSDHVLFNLLNELEKIGLARILSLFNNEIIHSIILWARMLDSIYHMALKLFKIAFLVWKRQNFAIFYATL